MADSVYLGKLGQVSANEILPQKNVFVDTVRCGMSWESHALPDFTITIVNERQGTVEYVTNDVYTFELTPSEQKLLEYVVSLVKSENPVDMSDGIWTTESRFSYLFDGSYMYLGLSFGKVDKEWFLCLWADNIPWNYYLIGDAIAAIANNHICEQNRGTLSTTDVRTRTLFESKLLLYFDGQSDKK